MRCEPFRVEVDRRPVVLVHPERPAQCHPIGRPLRLQCEAFCRRPLKVSRPGSPPVFLAVLVVWAQLQTGAVAVGLSPV